MYNLSPRWTKIRSTTPDKLGPNQYYLDSKQILKNRIPFISSTERNTLLFNKYYSDAVYEVGTHPKVIGGSSLMSKGRRDTDRPPDYPGPGHYNPKYIPKKCPRVITEPKKGNKLYLCRVPYNLQAVAPSVPTTLDENGYTKDSKGLWIKNPPDYSDGTLGPAFYNVPNVPCLTTRLYKGCRWSLRKLRWDFKTATTESPGPGAYDTRYKKTVNNEYEYIREMARLYSYAPRHLDIMKRKTDRDNFPGPDRYTITTSVKPKSLSRNPAGFGSRSERQDFNVSCTPPPTSYNVSGDLLKRSVSIKDTAFNVLGKRFEDKTKYNTPAPGKYDVQAVIDEKLQKSLQIHVESRPAFNHSAQRMAAPFGREQGPGPAQYMVEVLAKEPGQCDGSVFRSMTTRFKPPKLMIGLLVENSNWEEQGDQLEVRTGDHLEVRTRSTNVHKLTEVEPFGGEVDSDLEKRGAASYSVSEPFNKNRDRKSHNVGRVPFQSTRPRRQAFRTPFCAAPDPCKYKVHENMQTKGFYFNKTDRFTEKEETPGPGCYTIHPSIGLSMYKAMTTQNLNLKEQVLRSKIRLHPDKTRIEFHKEIKKRKQLTCFYKPPPPKVASWMTMQ